MNRFGLVRFGMWLLWLVLMGFQVYFFGLSMSTSWSANSRPRERFIPNPKLRFLDQCREVMGFKRFSPRTVEAYVHWIRRFIVWSGKRHPQEMGAVEVNGFLGHLALQAGVAASTQNQAELGM